MARARGIKPSIFKNEVLGVADPLYTLLFEGLWCLADREGRLEDRPLRIKAEVFPYRDGIDMNSMLDWLQSAGFIQRYEAEGKRCVLVCEFVKHQNPHKNEVPSELPAPVSEVVPNKSEQIPNKSEALGLTPDSLNLTPDSLIKEEPSGSCRLAPPSDRQPSCPHEQIVKLYHDKLPDLPAVRVMDEKRKRKLKGFWVWVLTSKKSDGTPRAIGADQALTWIGQYFERASANDFVMGRIERNGGHANWKADIEYLCGESGRKQVIERTAVTA